MSKGFDKIIDEIGSLSFLSYLPDFLGCVCFCDE